MIQFDPTLPSAITQERLEQEHMIVALLFNRRNFKLYLDPDLLESYNKQWTPSSKTRIVLTGIPPGKSAVNQPNPKLTIKTAHFVSGVTELVSGEPGEYRYEVCNEEGGM